MSRILLPFIACYAMFGQVVERFEADLAAMQARFQEPANPHDKEWVKRRLAHLYEVDQMARSAYIKDPEHRKELAKRVTALAHAHVDELKELLKIYRWFPISEFGEHADTFAWILVQHADFDVPFQREVLAILETLLPKGETNKNSYANLWDRVAKNSGKPQRYGTQGGCKAGQWVADEVEDPEHLDERRAAVGYQPMAAYLKLENEKGYCR